MEIPNDRSLLLPCTNQATVETMPGIKILNYNKQLFVPKLVIGHLDWKPLYGLLSKCHAYLKKT